MEPDTWLNDCREHYKHISIHVDDLLIASKYPQGSLDTLTKKYNFKLKGTDPISYHLGCDFGRNGDETRHLAPRKSIENIEECYCSIFGSKPKLIFMLPLDKCVYAELDSSKHLNQVGIHKNQSLVGAIKWSASLGRLDPNAAVATLASFRAKQKE